MPTAMVTTRPQVGDNRDPLRRGTHNSRLVQPVVNSSVHTAVMSTPSCACSSAMATLQEEWPEGGCISAAPVLVDWLAALSASSQTRIQLPPAQEQRLLLYSCVAVSCVPALVKV